MKYSFVVPIYNDGYLADKFCVAFEKCFQEYIGSVSVEGIVELIFVNDGSKNDSLTHLKNLPSKYSFVKVVDLSRNFGQHIALSCGYKLAKGEYVGMLNVDMQEPPSEIPKLIDYMNSEGYDIVFGLAEQRKTSIINRVTSLAFAKTLNYLTNTSMPANVTTLRVMNRKFVDAYNSISEKSRYIPGLEAWLGFRHGYTPILHQERSEGSSSYNFKKRLAMAIESIISFSDFPLRLIATFGLAVALFGFLMTLFLLLGKIFFVDYQAGYATTVSLILLVGGIQIMVIGFSSLYIGRILKEVQNRPLYVINETYNFHND